MRLVVDGIDEGVARLEGERSGVVEVPAALLPRGVREGDVLELLVLRDGERSLLSLRRDPDERRRRLDDARRRLERLGGRDRGGDVEL